jgi:hypothetical protein
LTLEFDFEKYLRKSKLWSEDFTAKLFCNVEFWLERLPKFTGLCERQAIVIPISGFDLVTKGRAQAMVDNKNTGQIQHQR